MHEALMIVVQLFGHVFTLKLTFLLFCRARFTIKFFTVLQNTLHLTVGCVDINRLVLIEISFMGNSFVLMITSKTLNTSKEKLFHAL